MNRIEIMKDIINFDSSNDDGNALQCNLDDHYEITIFFVKTLYSNDSCNQFQLKSCVLKRILADNMINIGHSNWNNECYNKIQVFSWMSYWIMSEVIIVVMHTDWNHNIFSERNSKWGHCCHDCHNEFWVKSLWPWKILIEFRVNLIHCK